MAIQATVMTKYGEERELYIRINHAPSVTYDGVTPVSVLLRGYVGDFEPGKQYMWSSDEIFDDQLPGGRLVIEYDQNELDLNGDIRQQVYERVMNDVSMSKYMINMIAV